MVSPEVPAPEVVKPFLVPERAFSPPGNELIDKSSREKSSLCALA